MLRFLADENFNNDIVRGVLRGDPVVDIVRVQAIGVASPCSLSPRRPQICDHGSSKRSLRSSRVEKNRTSIQVLDLTVLRLEARDHLVRHLLRLLLRIGLAHVHVEDVDLAVVT